MNEMIECEECGKKLGNFEGYRHPTMGKKYLLCGPCFDKVEESVSSWGAFVLANSFNNGLSKSDSKLNWKRILTSSTKIQNIIDNVKSENEICIQV
jgi:hypothetical protein